MLRGTSRGLGADRSSFVGCEWAGSFRRRTIAVGSKGRRCGQEQARSEDSARKPALLAGFLKRKAGALQTVRRELRKSYCPGGGGGTGPGAGESGSWIAFLRKTVTGSGWVVWKRSNVFGGRIMFCGVRMPLPLPMIIPLVPAGIGDAMVRFCEPGPDVASWSDWSRKFTGASGVGSWIAISSMLRAG
jgi:hypothetical protein